MSRAPAEIGALSITPCLSRRFYLVENSWPNSWSKVILTIWSDDTLLTHLSDRLTH